MIYLTFSCIKNTILNVHLENSQHDDKCAYKNHLKHIGTRTENADAEKGDFHQIFVSVNNLHVDTVRKNCY